MTLYSTLQMAKNAMFAARTGIEVASNNIANADTPGYIRERAILTPSAPQRTGNLITGSGVHVEGVVRQVNVYLQERMRYAVSDMANGEAQESVYVELESAIGELSESDLSTALSEFFNRLNDVLNQPEGSSVRKLAVLEGQRLAEMVRQLDGRVSDVRTLTNDQIVHAVNDVNELVNAIAMLNTQIVEMELGGHVASDAVGLRDKRDKALEDLARLVNIQVEEQDSGATNVFVGGDYLVFDGTSQFVTMVKNVDRGQLVAELRLSRTDSVLQASAGEIAGLVTARDDVLGGFLDDLDSFTRSLIFEFNKLHSSGQGLGGYDALRSEHRIDDADAPLDEAGLVYTPVDGEFQVQVINRETGLTKTADVEVQLNGLEEDTTFEGLIAALDAIEGLSAERAGNGQLLLRSESEDYEFTFANDSSGILAALGINTFFTGTAGSDIRVHEALDQDAGKLAVSLSGVGHDTENGQRLAQFLTTPLESRDNVTLAAVYEQWMAATAQSSSLAQAVAEGYRSFHATLEGEHLGLSGVSLDEEALNMMTFQRTYQAAARVVSTISELLEILMRM